MLSLNCVGAYASNQGPLLSVMKSSHDSDMSPDTTLYPYKAILQGPAEGKQTQGATDTGGDRENPGKTT